MDCETFFIQCAGLAFCDYICAKRKNGNSNSLRSKVTFWNCMKEASDLSKSGGDSVKIDVTDKLHTEASMD